MIKAGIIGGAGYTAGELIRLLLNHPETEIVFINRVGDACFLLLLFDLGLGFGRGNNAPHLIKGVQIGRASCRERV